ncbi:MAG TPA: hypothetical protein VGK67_14350 [Myxococcales bacterium]|jgi:hypothetical protein
MTITRIHRARGRRLVLLGLLLATAGCATTVPIQTASTVPVGTVRLSGQASLAIYCGFADISRCAFGNTTPELRLAGRTGLHDRVDLGASLFFVSHFASQGPEWGGLLDGKVELWRAPIAEGRKQVLSAGLGLAVSGYQISGYSQPSRGIVETDVVVPLRWGYQFAPLELFVGAHFRERFVFGVLAGNKVADVPAGGLSLGVVSRKRAKIGVALNYEAPLRYFDRGAITMGLGFLFDLGGDYPRAAPSSSPVLFTPEGT